MQELRKRTGSSLKKAQSRLRAPVNPETGVKRNFGEPNEKQKNKLNAIADLEQLDRIALKVLTAKELGRFASCAMTKMSTTMTEAQWLASTDAAAMGEAVVRKRRATPRALRLYMAAFWSWQSPRLETQEERDKLKQRAAWVEEWADTEA